MICSADKPNFSLIAERTSDVAFFGYYAERDNEDGGRTYETAYTGRDSAGGYDCG